MINIIVELSKYLMIALMLVYTFECFAVFNYTDEYTQRSIFRKQNVLMFLLHMIAFLVMYLQTNETKMIGFYGMQVVLFLAIGSGFLVYGFMNFLRGDSGWREISVKAGSELNCSEDFTLKYNVGAGGVSAGGEAKALSLIYTDAAVKGYRLFNIDESFDDVTNLYDINRHPNEVMTVDPVLYDALKKVSDANCREIYLGPLYASLENLCMSNDDAVAAQFDPEKDDDAAEEAAAVAAFAQNPDDISMEFPGENQVCLHVSDAYQAYAAEMGYTAYLDFFWMKNAFLIDYLADTIRGEGYQLGIISSKDGFVRCLDETGEKEYQYPLYHLSGNEIQSHGTMTYEGPKSIVFFHAYQAGSPDTYRYYQYQDGTMRTPYLSASDGKDHTAASELLVYSGEYGCADTLLAAFFDYQAESLSGESLKTLASQKIYSVWFENNEIQTTDEKFSATAVNK